MRIDCTEELHTSGGPGRFLLARAEDALEALIAEYGGTVQLIYLDPPFGTGDTFHMRLTGGKKTVGVPAFSDTMPEDQYLDWMRSILSGCRQLLAPSGSIYLHIDYRMSAHLRLMMDDIFGAKNFMNEIIWSYKSGGRSMRYYPRKHDTILFYRKTNKVFFNIAAVGKPRGPGKRNHMKRFINEDGRICFSIRSNGKTYVYYEDTPMYPTDVWNDIEHLQQKDRERVGYATQKPEALLERIIFASSRPGDLVVDLFSGSGTTAAVASKLNRRFLVTDASPFALYTLRSRLLGLSSEASLLDDSHMLRLCFQTDPTDAMIDCDVAHENGRCIVTVRKAYFDPSHPILYAALGTAEGNVFHPLAAHSFPRLPLVLSAKEISAPVLQITDALGRYAFFTL